MTEREREVIVTDGGGGGGAIVAAIVAVLVVVLLLWMFVFSNPGADTSSGGEDVNVTVDVGGEDG